MRRWRFVWVLVPVFVISVFAYSIGMAQAKTVMQSSDATRWHVVTNPGDSSKTFLVDSLIGETFVLASSGDSHTWKKMEKTK